MTHVTIRVPGMTCGHCARTVERAAAGVPGVAQARVDLAQKTLTIAGEADAADVRAAVQAVGYATDASASVDAASPRRTDADASASVDAASPRRTDADASASVDAASPRRRNDAEAP